MFEKELKREINKLYEEYEGYNLMFNIILAAKDFKRINSWQIKGTEIEKIVDKIDEVNNFICSYGCDNYKDYLDIGENILSNKRNAGILKEIIQERGDLFTSDREIVALAIVLDELRLVADDGKTILDISKICMVK